jgi:hypothetical protein
MNAVWLSVSFQKAFYSETIEAKVLEGNCHRLDISGWSPINLDDAGAVLLVV